MRVFIDPSSQIRTDSGKDLPKIFAAVGMYVLPAAESTPDTKAFDLLVIDADVVIPEKLYLMALALAEKKHVLCLRKKGTPIPDELDFVLRESVFSGRVQLEFYHPKKLEQTIADTLRKLGASSVKEKPTIKFTLRITPSIEKYLEYKSRQSGMTKADYLRSQIEDLLITPDTEYRDLLQ